MMADLLMDKFQQILDLFAEVLDALFISRTTLKSHHVPSRAVAFIVQ